MVVCRIRKKCFTCEIEVSGRFLVRWQVSSGKGQRRCSSTMGDLLTPSILFFYCLPQKKSGLVENDFLCCFCIRPCVNLTSVNKFNVKVLTQVEPAKYTLLALKPGICSTFIHPSVSEPSYKPATSYRGRTYRSPLEPKTGTFNFFQICFLFG